MQRRELYPDIEPYDHGMLKLSTLHTMYYEQCGNPNGEPVLFLHGGPGSGCGAKSRRFFDPSHYRIILFDQRGAGRSTPHAELRENTTPLLVSDIERLRAHLGIDRWQVFGGSWGSTLALAYAQTHPEKTKTLVLRGIFLLRRFELEWFYQHGASMLFPEAWQDYLAPIAPAERGDLISAYYRRLTSNDETIRATAAKAWAQWEARLSFIAENQDYVSVFEDPKQALSFAAIESHYFVHGGFFAHDDQLLRDAARLSQIPTVIVHGRYDVVCPPQNAYDLGQAMPHAKLIFVADAGHSGFESGVTDALIQATDAFRN